MEDRKIEWIGSLSKTYPLSARFLGTTNGRTIPTNAHTPVTIAAVTQAATILTILDIHDK